MSFNRMAIPVLALFAFFGSVSAQALPQSTLYVQATRFLEETQGPLSYIGYMELNADEEKRYGFQIVPMEESVADELASLQENKIVSCSARYFRNGRAMYVYDLSDCH